MNEIKFISILVKLKVGQNLSLSAISTNSGVPKEEVTQTLKILMKRHPTLGKIDEIQGLFIRESGKASHIAISVMTGIIRDYDRKFHLFVSKDLKNVLSRDQLTQLLTMIDDALAIGGDIKSWRVFELKQLFGQQLNILQNSIVFLTTIASAFQLGTEQLWTILGIIAMRFEMHTRAEALFQAALALSPQSVYALTCMGDLFFKQYRLEDAEEFYKVALAQDQYYLPALVNLALVYQELKRNTSAAGIYQRIFAIVPQDSAILFNYGLLLKQMNRPEEAMKKWQEIVAIDPKFPEAYYQQGIMHEEQQNLTEAKQAYEKAIEVAPRSWKHFVTAKQHLATLGDPSFHQPSEVPVKESKVITESPKKATKAKTTKNVKTVTFEDSLPSTASPPVLTKVDKAKASKIKGAMIINLFYDHEERCFTEQKGQSEAAATMVLDAKASLATVTFSPSINNIGKQIALRHARAICKSGYLLMNGDRIGVNFKLKEISE